MPSKVSAEKGAKPNTDGEKSGISNETILEPNIKSGNKGGRDVGGFK